MHHRSLQWTSSQCMSSAPGSFSGINKCISALLEKAWSVLTSIASRPRFPHIDEMSVMSYIVHSGLLCHVGEWVHDGAIETGKTFCNVWCNSAVSLLKKMKICICVHRSRWAHFWNKQGTLCPEACNTVLSHPISYNFLHPCHKLFLATAHWLGEVWHLLHLGCVRQLFSIFWPASSILAFTVKSLEEES